MIASGSGAAGTMILAAPAEGIVPALEVLEQRLRWLSAWTIHHANICETVATG